MGCCGGDREKNASLKNDVKWEYVNLNDFKSTSCFTPLAYFYLWFMLFVLISVYGVDTFTAINLLAFNRWAGQIKPALDLKYSRWVFAGCIILSFILLIFRWMRALKVMRGGKVAKAYLDPLAVRVECIKMGESRGWKRFLVFAELTKSRKGADYVALFSYFSFEAWLRIVFAEGPRQVINAMTLVAYAEANFVPVGDHAAPVGQSPFVQFWKNFAVLAEQDHLQVAIIIGMLWTLLIWVISAISLIVSVILYLIFLWHHIPSDAGGLSGYCGLKINKRMERLVRTKTDKALKKENEIRARQEARAIRDGTDFKRQPTLPNLSGEPSTTSLVPLSRQSTTTTLPEYTSRPGTAVPSEDRLPPMPTPNDANIRPGAPRRHLTSASDASWSSYNSSAPLMQSAGDMGYSPADRMQTPTSAVSNPWSTRPAPSRNLTGSSDYQERSFTPGPPTRPAPNRNFTGSSDYQERSFTPGPPTRPATSQSYRAPPGTYPLETLQRPGTGMSQRSRSRGHSNDSDMAPPPPRGTTPVSAVSAYAPSLPDTHGRRTPGAPGNNFSPVSPILEDSGRGPSAFMPQQPPSRSHTPMGPPSRSMTSGHAPPLPRIPTSSTMDSNSYMAFNPNLDRTASPAAMNDGYRGMNHSPMPMNMSIDRSRTPNFDNNNGSTHSGPPRSTIQRNGTFDDILNHY